MRLLVAAVLTLLPAGAGAVALQNAPVGRAPPPGSAGCPQTTSYYAYRDGGPIKPHKLSELPPANVYSAVFRRIGGCEVPLVVKYGVGSRSQR